MRSNTPTTIVAHATWSYVIFSIPYTPCCSPSPLLPPRLPQANSTQLHRLQCKVPLSVMTELACRRTTCPESRWDTLWQYQERQQPHITPDWARGHNGHGTIVTSKPRFAASSTARQQDRDSHSVLTQGNDLLDEHDVAVASVGSGGLVHARHRAFQELLTAP
eukprot:scaffold20316_cov66-Phaeocystis_antarctica.AAC.8